MEVAELFVKLGVKGAEQTAKSVGVVDKGMTKVQNSSLAAKAAILAVVYAVERLAVTSGARGNSLEQFARFMGDDRSTKWLQKWEYQATRFGVSAQEVESSMRGIYNAQAQLQQGHAPKLLEMLQRLTGADVRRLMNDTEYFADKVRQFAQDPRTANAFGTDLLRSAGVGDNLIAAMRQKSFDPDKTPVGMLLSQKTIHGLDRFYGQWKQFTYSLGVFGQNKTLLFGPGILKELSGAFEVIQEIDRAVTKLMRKFPSLGADIKIAFVPLITALGLAVGPLTALGAAVTGLIYLLGEWRKHEKGDKNSLFGDKDFNGNALERAAGGKDKLKGFWGRMFSMKSDVGNDQDLYKELQTKGLKPNPMWGQLFSVGSGEKSSDKSVTINNYGVNNEDLPKVVEKTLKRHYNNAHRANPATRLVK